MSSALVAAGSIGMASCGTDTLDLAVSQSPSGVDAGGVDAGRTDAATDAGRADVPCANADTCVAAGPVPTCGESSDCYPETVRPEVMMAVGCDTGSHRCGLRCADSENAALDPCFLFSFVGFGFCSEGFCRECRVDADCTRAPRCVRGVCGECTKDTDCASGSRCSHFACVRDEAF